MKLSELKTGERGIIVKVSGHGSFRKRITEMGFIKGKEVKVVLNAPLRDPIEYEIIGYKISLRRDEASEIEVISESEAKVPIHGPEENPPMNWSAEKILKRGSRAALIAVLQEGKVSRKFNCVFLRHFGKSLLI